MSTPAIISAKDCPTLCLYIHFDGYDKDMIKEIVELARNRGGRNVNDDESYGMMALACAANEYSNRGDWETGYGINTIEDGHPNVYYNYWYTIDSAWNIECTEPTKK